jgi:mono/diheme cytochrome c family protein
MRLITLLALAFAGIFAACSDSELVSMHQLSSGAKLYEQHCSNCHQTDGSGLALLIPPLQKADYLINNALLLPCLIRNGAAGAMAVNGQIYNQKMPGNAKLSDAEILDICRFVLQKYPEKPISVGDENLILALQKCDSIAN